MSEIASLLEVKLKHASLKHSQTIGAVERSHGPLNEFRSSILINNGKTGINMFLWQRSFIILHITQQQIVLLQLYSMAENQKNPLILDSLEK